MSPATMARTSIYDRISERRLAAEALARQQAQQAADAGSLVIEPEPKPVPVVPLQLASTELKLSGLRLLMPHGLNFLDLNTTLEKDGHPVTFSAKRRPAPEGQSLNHVADSYVTTLRKQHPDITLVRRGECLLAGNPAVSLDYVFNAGQERRHGRATHAIIDVANGGERQWFSLSTMINPDHAALASWLIEFDDMISAIAAC